MNSPKCCHIDCHFKYFCLLYQCTPLHVAASKGRDYTVKWLVHKGADMDIKDNNGVSETKLLMEAIIESTLSKETVTKQTFHSRSVPID